MPDCIMWPAENAGVVEVRRLPAINLAAWKATCVELATAIATESGLIALVGPIGSGKTYTLEAFARARPQGGQAAIRRAGQPRAAGVSLDLVDALDGAALERLQREPEHDGRRVVALRPDFLDALLHWAPGTRVIRMRPMDSRDVRAMLDARCRLLRLPAGALTLKAMSAIEKRCGGNPGKLDELLRRALLTAQAAKSLRISAEHVEKAARAPVADAPIAASPVPPPAAQAPASPPPRPSSAAWAVLTQPPSAAELARKRTRRRLKVARAAAMLAAPAALLAVCLQSGALSEGRQVARVALAALVRYGAAIQKPGSAGTAANVPLPATAPATPPARLEAAVPPPPASDPVQPTVAIAPPPSPIATSVTAPPAAAAPPAEPVPLSASVPAALPVSYHHQAGAPSPTTGAAHRHRKSDHAKPG